MNTQSLLQNETFWIVLALFDLTLKGITLWKSAKKDQKVWFVALLILNTVGILPLIYLLVEYYQQKGLRKITVFERIKEKFSKK